MLNLIIFLLHGLILTTQGVVIPDSALEGYLKRLTSDFQRDSTNNRFDHIIPPPKIGSDGQSTLWPKVFIWCPMEHFNLEVLCPVHHTRMKAGFFTDQIQKKSPRNPRLVYDLRGNILLIQRVYVCQHGSGHHKYFSASLEVLETLPKLYGSACFPVVMFYQSACTKDLVDFIETQTLQGVSFLKMCHGIAAMNFNEYCERIERYGLSLTDSSSSESDSNELDGFYSNIIFGFPSNDKLMEIFLEDFYTKQPMYSTKMEEVARVSTCLTCDHTFKISKYIGASRGSDKKFVRQFENLYIMINENRHIVGWRLTKTTAFEEVRDLLEDLKNVLKEDLEMVIVDDCCKVRAKYESIFPNVNIKLDVFHAVQRIVKTFPKGTEASKQISKDFGLIFRKDGDCGDSREQSTPDPDVIERNLDNFIVRWRGILNSETNVKTLHELDNLKVHIRKGCLSQIPPGYGTECNERLHHTLNDSLLCGSSTISPEIAIAVLSLIFYGINCQKNGKKHKNNARIVPFIPLPKHVLRKRDEETNDEIKSPFLKASAGENVPDKVWEQNAGQSGNFDLTHTEPEIVIIEDIRDMLNDSVAAVICDNTFKLCETLNKVGSQCNDRSLNVSDLPIMQLFGVKQALVTDELMLDNSRHAKEQLLSRNLQSFNLTVDPVDGDGDCAFSSIIKQLQKKTCARNSKTPNTHLEKHLTELDLGGGFDHVYRLRELFVNAVQSNENYQMLLGVDERELNFETERFRDQGTFCGEMGDLVMKVCSDLLQVPIIVVTSIPGCPYLPFIPEQQATTESLYLSFNNYGPGHYDATSLLDDSDVNTLQEEDKSGCSCGRNDKNRNASSCLPQLIKRGRKCPCVILGKSCGSHCRCKGCKNAVTSKDAAEKSLPLSCRCGESKSSVGISCNNTDNRKSRCPCLKNNQPCTENCFCKNCKNVFGENMKVTGFSATSPAAKRKRSNPSPYKKKRSADFLLQNKCALTSSVWSIYETCLLFSTVNVLVSTGVPLSVNNVSKLYNYVAKSSVCETRKLPVRIKNASQIQGKLKNLEEKQKVTVAKI